MNVLKSTAVVLGLAVAPWLVPQGITGAAASTLSAAISAAPEAASPVEQVQQRRYQRREARREFRRYEQRRHGPRYRHRRPTHRHYYGGWWYSTPWWIGPSITFGFGSPYYYGSPYYGNAHVQWCLNRYRSYDPASDTFMGFDGLRHRCRSPYRP